MNASDPTLLAQLSDPHLKVGRKDTESANSLAAAVRGVLALKPRPHAVIVSGDLANTPDARAYERVRELLAPLPMPVFVLAGNHDDRDGLREYFALDGSTGAVGEPFLYTAQCRELRLVVADTTLPGHEEGALGFERRAWIEAELAAEPATPTVLALHHPPIAIGIHALDEIGLPDADRTALAYILALNPQVRRVITGHVHRGVFGVLGGCGVVTCPSTWLQAPLEIPGEGLHLVPEPAGFALHAHVGDAIASHIQPIER